MALKKLVFPALALLAATYAGLATYAVADQTVEDLLLCADKGGLRIPFSKSFCRGYLFAFRGTPRDIDALHLGIGASFVLQGQAPPSEREELLRFLISKGLDVNRIDMHKLTPLHSAVAANSPAEVELLLRNGASVRLKDAKFGLTPLDFAYKLQIEQASADRSAVVALLMSAAQR